jgi:hypothetical protein
MGKADLYSGLAHGPVISHGFLRYRFRVWKSDVVALEIGFAI